MSNSQASTRIREAGVVRGGRVTKLNGRDASYCPLTGRFFASGSSLAMAAAVAFAVPAMFGGATSAQAAVTCMMVGDTQVCTDDGGAVAGVDTISQVVVNGPANVTLTTDRIYSYNG